MKIVFVLTSVILVLGTIMLFKQVPEKPKPQQNGLDLLKMRFEKKNPEAALKTPDYLKHFNYPFEEHFITTEDGYILRFYRIQAKNSQIKSGQKPIYLQHGLMDNSDTFLINYEFKAPAFMLANAGYDVWMGNSRGNYQSRNHTHYDPSKDKAFWDFSFQNMSRFDLSAAFTYIVNKTGFDKIDYIGHSQGSMIMLIALAEQNMKVKQHLNHVILWGPVMFVSHQTSPVFNAMAHSALSQILDFFKVEEVFAYSWLNHPIMIEICALDGQLCREFLGPIADADPKLDNSSRMDVLMGHDPAGTSLMNLKHWQQFILNGKWQQYDYGSKQLNQQHYKQDTPPLWDPLQVDYPLYLMAGSSDRLADPADVGLLLSKIINCPKLWFKNYDSGHLTFVWGNEVLQMEDTFLILEGKLD